MPPSIDATGSRDVASQLQAFIDKAPNGSTVVLARGGRYRLGHEIQITNKRNFTLEGNGARVDLTGKEGSDSKGIQVRGGSGTTIRNLTMVGNNNEAGTPDACCTLESQHAIALASARDTLIENVDIRRVWGDCLYVNALTVGGTWSNGVTLRDSNCRLTGRHGVGIIRGSNIRIVDNVFDKIGFMVFDIEPDQSDGGAKNVVIRGNDIGTYGLGDQYDPWLLAACGAQGSVVRNVTLAGNTVKGNRSGWAGRNGRPVKALSIRVCGDGRVRRNFKVTDNVTETPIEGPDMRFFEVRGLTIKGNKQPLSSGKLAYFPDSTDVTYEP